MKAPYEIFSVDSPPRAPRRRKPKYSTDAVILEKIHQKMSRDPQLKTTTAIKNIIRDEFQKYDDYKIDSHIKRLLRNYSNYKNHLKK